MAVDDFAQLLEVVDKLTTRLTILQTEINNISSSQAINKGVGSALQTKLYEVRALEISLTNINRELTALRAQTPGVGYIAHPSAPPTTTPDAYAAFRQKLQQDQIIKEEKAKTLYQRSYFSGGDVPVEGPAIPQSKNPWAGTRAKIFEAQEQERINASLSEREKLERRRIESAKKLLQSEARFQAVLDAAAKQGFTLNDLKGVRTRGTAGVVQSQFEKYNEFGVRQNLDLFSSPGGRVTPGISNQFRSFGQGVLRDIGELTKWSLALAAVYGPMQKLQELTQEMIENQTKLADAAIAVNSSLLSQGEIFDIASDAAQRAGEDVSGVIDAFTLAFRAAGGGANQVERLSNAQSLLADSLTLSKLSTLDQATAIDTLAAAIRQTNGNFDEATTLLDSWVRVTKIANVDLTTLATGFAVLGDAAEAAGIDTHELNGVIAAVAETGIGSGKEVANIARALVSGFQSDNARKELEALGIAVEDASGQMRPFLEIMQEIYNLRENEIIDDTQFSRLTLALGGGTRRQAAYSSFISNFDRVFEVAQQSEKASGDAEAALAKQLETVQTSLTNLGNAFSSLAQTMGTEGGFLGIIQASVEGTTGLVNVFDDLVGLLGKATPALAAFATTALILKSQGRGGLANVIQGFGQSLITPQGTGPNGQQFLPGFGPQLTRDQRIGNFVGTNILGSNALSGGIQGALLSALPALANGLNTEDRFGGTKAVADVAGGVIGGVVGALAGPQGALIGATIGVSISEAFINATIARKTDLFGYQTEAGLLGQPTDRAGDDELRKDLETAEAGLYKSIGFGSESLGRLLTADDAKLGDALVEKLNTAIKEGDEGKLKRTLAATDAASPGLRGRLAEAGLTDELINTAFKNNQQLQFSGENLAYGRASEGARSEFDAALAAYTATQGDQQNLETPFSRLLEDNKNNFEGLINTIKEESKTQLSADRLSGDVKGAEYARRTAAIGGFDTKALQYYTALGDVFKELNSDINSDAEAFEAFNKIIISGAAETIPEITSIVSEIQTLINILNDPTLTEDKLKKLGFDDRGQVEDRLKELQGAGANILTDVLNQANLTQLQIPGIQGDRNKPLTTDELNKIVLPMAQKFDEQFYQGFLGLSDEQFSAMKDSFEEWAQIVEESGETFFQKIAGISPEAFQQAMSVAAEQGLLGSQQTNPFGIQQLDIPSSEAGNLQGQIDYFTKYLAQNFPQYQQNPEDVGVIFSDYVTDVLHGDNLAIKLALQKLVDINQKQLDGMYNIPEGATFWVPLTAAYYRPQNAGGAGGGMPNVEGLPENTNATQENTNALVNLGLSMEGLRQYQESERNRVPVGREPGRHENRYDYMNDTRPNFEDRFDRMNDLEGYRASRQGDESHSVVSILETAILGSLQSVINSITQGLTNTVQQMQGGGGSVGSRDMSSVAPVVQARLDFRVENSTQLMVDGRVLASVITPYLASDLIRLEASQGTITKKYII